MNRMASSRRPTGMPKEFVVAEKGTGIAAIGDGASIHAKVPQFTRLHQHGRQVAQRRPDRL